MADTIETLIRNYDGNPTTEKQLQEIENDKANALADLARLRADAERWRKVVQLETECKSSEQFGIKVWCMVHDAIRNTPHD